MALRASHGGYCKGGNSFTINAYSFIHSWIHEMARGCLRGSSGSRSTGQFDKCSKGRTTIRGRTSEWSEIICWMGTTRSMTRGRWRDWGRTLRITERDRDQEWRPYRKKMKTNWKLEIGKKPLRFAKKQPTFVELVGFHSLSHKHIWFSKNFFT